MQIYGKSIASIESTDNEKFGPNGGFTAVLSTPSLDRDEEEVKSGEWIEPFEDRYPLDVDHGMSVSDTIGSFHPYFDGDRLMMDAAFASTQKAQDTRALIQEGHINHVSVAFMRHKSKKSAGAPYRELLNAGVVGVPANRDAVILASKAASALKDAFTDGEVPDEVKKAVLDVLGSKEPETKGLLEIFTKAVGGDAAMVQAIHDASGHLGAQCVDTDDDEEPDVDEDSGASDGANKSVEKSEESDETDLKSAENGENTPEIGPDSEISIDGRKLSFDEFKAVALETSSLESSANDAAAAEQAAAADEADEEVVDENRAARMEMLLFASESD